MYGFHNIDFDVEDHAYVADKLGSYASLSKGSSDFYVANKFKKVSEDDEILKKVTVNTILINQKYDIYYFPDGNLKDLQNAIWIYSGYSDKNGYSTIDVSSLNIKIENDSFALAVKYYTKDSKNTIPIYKKSLSTSYELDVATGTSFMSSDGVTWENLSITSGGNVENCYASIKAYTNVTVLEIDVPDTGKKINNTIAIICIIVGVTLLVLFSIKNKYFEKN